MLNNYIHSNNKNILKLYYNNFIYNIRNYHNQIHIINKNYENNSKKTIFNVNSAVRNIKLDCVRKPRNFAEVNYIYILFHYYIYVYIYYRVWILLLN